LTICVVTSSGRVVPPCPRSVQVNPSGNSVTSSVSIFNHYWYYGINTSEHPLHQAFIRFGHGFFHRNVGSTIHMSTLSVTGRIEMPVIGPISVFYLDWRPCRWCWSCICYRTVSIRYRNGFCRYLLCCICVLFCTLLLTFFSSSSESVCTLTLI
jgi:hypothetical protein